jgi:hypothetical protein
LNAQPAFKGKHVCNVASVYFCVNNMFHITMLLIDENLPGAHGVMRLAHALVQFFMKSLQKTKELKDIQQVLTNVYTRKAVGRLQDVVTRWWSTHHMLC